VSYLLYCILNSRRGPARPSIRGVREQAVWVLECGDLCAAVSEDTSPDSPRGSSSPRQFDDLLAYAKVVEAFNRRETVVPMRYGCRFKGVAQVRAWVRSNAAHLCTLMRRVDGCVEMGVRALLLEAAPPASSLVRNTAPSGVAYLAARRAELMLARHGDRVAQLVRDAMAGCLRECFEEMGRADRRSIVSLYFLVERRRLGAFREAFGRIASADASLMLSGPWPPYNFVCGAATGDELALRRALR
jgi:hypothetical protein